MDQFPDGTYMRLRSRVRRGSYLHADEDGVGVSLRPLGRVRDPTTATLNAAWRVHRVVRDGIVYVLLHGAAYGRYLALSPEPDEAERAGSGHDRGVSAIQRGYDARDLDAVMWKPVPVAGANTGGYVRLRHVYNGNLRANGRFRPWNNTRVTVDQYFGTTSTMRHWKVEVVPPRQGPSPALPLTTGNPGGRSGLLRRRTGPEADRRRMIRWLRSDDPRNFGSAGLPGFPFYGRSVLNLRFEVGNRANPGNPGDVLNSIICVKAGLYGRLTPLVTDLPRSDERMDVVVFTAGSPGAEELVYPDVHAQGQ